jgi:cobalt/nickel transport system permease protein
MQFLAVKMIAKLNTLPRWFKVYFGAVAVILGTTGMHIPDGYLSPVTSIIMFVLVLPFWIVGVAKLRATINARSVPVIALMAAFSFVIMMFNVPLPGGTTGHAVGAAIAAIVLGPGVASIAVSVALIIQAFLFGDGGILAIGANCFNMAVIIPYVSYAIYQWISLNTPVKSPRRLLGAGLGGYIGLSMGAFFTAIEFGIQPAFFKSAEGVPLYAPYPLSVAIPAMMIPHLLIAAVVEALLTVAVVAYLQRVNAQILEPKPLTELATPVPGRPRLRLLWIALGVLVVLSPIGLLAPGTAWGEWGAEELTSLGLSFIPRGLEKLSGLWGAPMPDYDIPALGNTSISYVLSAMAGVILTIIIVWLFSTLFTTHRANKEASEKRVN